jgi:hypothetical protein
MSREIAEIPTEPPDKSAVLDKKGCVWQNVAGRWFQAGIPRPMLGRPDSELWLGLLSKHGPLTVIFRADQADGVG